MRAPRTCTPFEVDAIIRAGTGALQRGAGQQRLVPVAGIRQAAVEENGIRSQLVVAGTEGQQVVGHETVQRMAAVGGVADGGIRGEGIVIHFAGKSLQVGERVDAVRCEDGIGLHESREAAAADLGNAEPFKGGTDVEVAGAFLFTHDGVALVHIGAQRVGKACALQGLTEEGGGGVGGNGLWQQARIEGFVTLHGDALHIGGIHHGAAVWRIENDKLLCGSPECRCGNQEKK